MTEYFTSNGLETVASAVMTSSVPKITSVTSTNLTLSKSQSTFSGENRSGFVTTDIYDVTSTTDFTTGESKTDFTGVKNYEQTNATDFTTTIIALAVSITVCIVVVLLVQIRKR